MDKLIQIVPFTVKIYLDIEGWQKVVVRPAYSDTEWPLLPLSFGGYRVWSYPALLCLIAGCAAPPSLPE